MISGKYIVEKTNEENISAGVLSKINNQIIYMKQCGITANLCYAQHQNKSILSKSCEYLVPFFPSSTSWKSISIDKTDKFLYIRRPSYISNDFIVFLKQIKNKFPNIYILLEVPTYPYEGEYRGIRHVILLKDRYNRNRLGTVVDNIVDIFNNNQLFGIDTIKIQNGVVVDSAFKKLPTRNTNDIKMVCAACFNFWHGMDRLIKGIYLYYNSGGSRLITLDLIGNGDEVSNYKHLVENLGLSRFIHFMPAVNSNKLYKLYSNYNLGVESLGRFRTGNISINSSLKSRDYLNAGLPFIGEGNVDVLMDSNYPYYFQVPSNDEPVCIDDVISFFDSIYDANEEERVIDTIHNFAYDNVDLHITFSPVVEAIKRHCQEND